MSSEARTLALLDLFTVDTPVRTSEDLIAAIGGSASTGYRHIKMLQNAGLLRRVGSSSYMLGTRFLEFDHVLRQTDPVYVAGSPVIERLRQTTRHSVVLSVLHSDSVVCIRRILAKDGPPDLFDRGQRRPLVAAASAKAILAWLPPHQLQRIYRRNGAAIAHAKLGGEYDTFRERLREIREKGWVITVSEFNKGIASIAAPIFNGQSEVLGSLMIAIREEDPRLSEFTKFAPDVTRAATKISEEIARLDPLTSQAARSVG